MSRLEVYHTPRGKVPYIKVTARIMGERQIEAWRALMALEGRRSCDLAGDIILEALLAALDNPEVTDLMRAIRRSTRGLHVVEDEAHDQAGNVHPLHGRDVAGPGQLPGQEASGGLPADGS